MEHYPIKKKGLPRQLNPNWDGIQWLEDATRELTEIIKTRPVRIGPMAGGCYIESVGSSGAAIGGNYPRRMFDLYDLATSSSAPTPVERPCPDCYDFSRSWTCEAHTKKKWICDCDLCSNLLDALEIARMETRNQ